MSIFENIARSAGRQDALDLRKRAKNMDGTQIIREEEKVPAFRQDKDYSKWPRNSPVADDGQVWLLLQPYDSKAQPGRPAELRSLWGLAHTQDPDRARPWVNPAGTSGVYKKGEVYREDNGTIYRCIVFESDQRAIHWPSGWEKVEA